MNGCCKIVTYRIYSYLCRPFLRKAELTRRYAAESNAFYPIRVCQCEAGTVTIRQFLFLFRGRFPVTDYRTDRVQYISGRQVIAFGYLGATRRFRGGPASASACHNPSATVRQPPNGWRCLCNGAEARNNPARHCWRH